MRSANAGCLHPAVTAASREPCNQRFRALAARAGCAGWNCLLATLHFSWWRGSASSSWSWGMPGAGSQIMLTLERQEGFMKIVTYVLGALLAAAVAAAALFYFITFQPLAT